MKFSELQVSVDQHLDAYRRAIKTQAIMLGFLTSVEPVNEMAKMFYQTIIEKNEQENLAKVLGELQ